MSEMSKLFCPKCKAEGIDYKIAPLYAIHEDRMRKINYLLPAGEVIPEILNKFTILVDCAYCYRKHGIVSISSNQSSNNDSNNISSITS